MVGNAKTVDEFEWEKDQGSAASQRPYTGSRIFGAGGIREYADLK